MDELQQLFNNFLAITLLAVPQSHLLLHQKKVVHPSFRENSLLEKEACQSNEPNCKTQNATWKRNFHSREESTSFLLFLISLVSLVFAGVSSVNVRFAFHSSGLASSCFFRHIHWDK